MRPQGSPDKPTSPRAIRRAERIARIRQMQADGLTNIQMAEALNITRSTLETFIGKYRVYRSERS